MTDDSPVPLAPEPDAAELRTDPLTGERTIVAPGRSRRPRAFAVAPVGSSDGTGAVVDASVNPFCEGNEHLTPPETFAIRPAGSMPNGPGWLVRIVPNRFPAITPDGADDDSCGLHEVIVECPQFESRFTALDATQLGHVFAAYQARLAAVRAEFGRGYGCVFKNSGPAAGATVEHLHSQLMVTRFVPPRVKEEIERARRFHEREGLPDRGGVELQRVLDEGRHVVLRTDDWAAYCEPSGRFPFELRLVPRERFARPETTPDAVIADLTVALPRLLRGLESLLPGLDYNLVLHTLPFEEPDDVPWFRWWIEVVPRLACFGGYELGVGTFINPIDPADAAARLREATEGG